MKKALTVLLSAVLCTTPMAASGAGRISAPVGKHEQIDSDLGVGLLISAVIVAVLVIIIANDHSSTPTSP